MNVPFYKYHGTGNDFIIIDQFRKKYLTTDDTELVGKLCERRFGIGADGLILLQPSDKHVFDMVYFNADGQVGSLCGNGSRCAVQCVHSMGLFDRSCKFTASDGVHSASRLKDGTIQLKMQPVQSVEVGKGYYIMDTGSPHYVTFVEDLSDLDIVQSGRAIRYADRFRETGINVNFVEEDASSLEVNTYERGVEDETLSCGTGVTAAALAHALNQQLEKGHVKVQTKGGSLTVKFKKDPAGFKDIWLCGPAVEVFQGKVSI